MSVSLKATLWYFLPLVVLCTCVQIKTQDALNTFLLTVQVVPLMDSWWQYRTKK